MLAGCEPRVDRRRDCERYEPNPVIFNDVTEDGSGSESEPGSGEDDDDGGEGEEPEGRRGRVREVEWEVPEGFAVGNEPDALSSNIDRRQ